MNGLAERNHLGPHPILSFAKVPQTKRLIKSLYARIEQVSRGAHPYGAVICLRLTMNLTKAGTIKLRRGGGTEIPDTKQVTLTS